MDRHRVGRWLDSELRGDMMDFISGILLYCSIMLIGSVLVLLYELIDEWARKAKR